MSDTSYNPNELMICSASRLLEDNSTVFIGTGLPMLAGALAQKMHTPNLISIFEFGGTGAILEELPLAVGERRSFHKALAASMKHDQIRFVEKVDFITTPGFLTGPGAREKAGLPPGTGPYRVVTTLGILGYDNKSKRMTLLSTQPGVSVDQVLENTGFELLVAEEITGNDPPSPAELRILREEVDKNKFYI